MTSVTSVSPTRVLMVEDNPVDVNILRLAFEEISDWPLEMIVAEDGEKAIRLLQEQAANLSAKADFIILDLNIPRRDGTEVLAVIRGTAALADLPVVILSSSPDDVIQRQLTAAGVAADTFAKPIHLEDFMELGPVLRNWYASQQRQRSRRSS